MTRTDDQDVRIILLAATADLRPSPELVERARRSGRQRQRRQRTAIVLSAAAVVLALTGTLALLRPPTPDAGRPAASPGTDARTRGDLAADTGYTGTVADTWNDWTRHWQQVTYVFHDIRLGPSRVSWAVSTPAGPVAVVQQQVTAVNERGGQQSFELTGFLCQLGGRPVVTDVVTPWAAPADQPYPALPGGIGGVFTGADRSVLVAFDPGKPVAYSLTRQYQPDGTIRRDWHPLSFVGGVAVVRVPPRANQEAAVVAAAPYSRTPTVFLANPSTNLVPADISYVPRVHSVDGLLRWGVYDLDGPDSGAKPDPRVCIELTPATEIGIDPGTIPFTDPVSSSQLAAGVWAACGITPDGGNVTVSDGQVSGDPPFVWYAVRSPAGAVRYGYVGPVDPAATLPVRVHLPDQLGYVVARAGALLSYRVGTGAWQGVRHDALLTPPDATAVRVVAAGVDTVVPLG